MRNEDNTGQCGNRLPVGEPCVCSALGGHAHSLQGGGNTGKQQDELSALTPLRHGRIISSTSCIGIFSFSVTETENRPTLDGLWENANYMESDTQVYL